MDGDRSRSDVEAVLAGLTWRQRLAQLGAAAAGPEPAAPATPVGDPPAARDPGFPDGLGGLTRPFGGAATSRGESAVGVAAVQSGLARDGLPGALVHEECVTGLMAPGATVTPSPLALAAAFDPDAVADIGDLVGEQLAGCGVHQGLAPVLDVTRDQRWGRVEETFGEDPYLVALSGAAWIRAVQARGVAATGKHFVAHGASSGGRNTAAVAVGAATLDEVHLPPWRAAIAAGLRAVMTAYHDLDDVPVHGDPSVVTGLLRERLGFDGLVVSDYWALNELVTVHRTVVDKAAAARAALVAGVAMELPRSDCLLALADAVAAAGGPDPELAAAVEQRTREVLRCKAAAGLLAAPRGGAGPVGDEPADAAGRVRRAAARGLVLLANDGTLPLRVHRHTRVAILGPHADDPRVLAGTYAWANHVGYAAAGSAASLPTPPVTLAAALAGALAVEEVSCVRLVAGCRGIDADDGVAADGRVAADGAAADAADDTELARAVAVAADSDVAVVVVGDLPGHFGRGSVGEGSDRSSLRLPAGQQRLVRAVAGTGTPVVLVVACGRAVDLTGVEDVAAAVLVAWFAGDGGGAAVADAILGASAPAGRLPVTFAPAGVQPLSYDHTARGGVAYRGDRDEPGAVHWFGAGLTYTTFARELVHAPSTAPTDGSIELAVEVTNTGDRDGEDVVQVYGRRAVAAHPQPELGRLVGFARVRVPAGGTVRVDVGIDSSAFAALGPDGTRTVAPGRLELRVADHGRDPGIAVAVELVGDAVPVPYAAPPRPAAVATRLLVPA